MAVPQQIKDWVDASTNTDRALLNMYCLGVDDTAIIVDLGKSMVQKFYTGYDPEEVVTICWHWQSCVKIIYSTSEYM